MSDFVTAIHFKTEDQGAVIDALVQTLRGDGYEMVPLVLPGEDVVEDPTRSRLRRFFVSPEIGGWVSVFDENFVEVFGLPGRLCTATDVPTILLWRQGRKSWGYSLRDAGRLLDEFATDPNYLEGACGGRPDVLCEYGTGTVEQFRRLLEEGKGAPRAAQPIFAKLMGIPNAECDFEDMETGQTSEVQLFEEFVKINFLLRGTAIGGTPLPEGLTSPGD
ncbi:MAG: hypothetical protein HUU15_09025 [Candidatus Brocadiae bacterium]|nr:hypothetical protein [Candidatus Brocadiia bacterium]